mmetsp:Transcript_15093/g.14576  ORF Transcript_15093/g.14576 Transcript_15093/m.14576 type:complete len:81 (+) Transcript_15093:358-600(+)
MRFQKKLTQQPDFAWWTPRVLKKRDMIISSVKQRVKFKNNNYGILIPKTLKEFRDIKKTNNNIVWKRYRSKRDEECIGCI